MRCEGTVWQKLDNPEVRNKNRLWADTDMKAGLRLCRLQLQSGCGCRHKESLRRLGEATQRMEDRVRDVRVRIILQGAQLRFSST